MNKNEILNQTKIFRKIEKIENDIKTKLEPSTIVIHDLNYKIKQLKSKNNSLKLNSHSININYEKYFKLLIIK